MSRAKVIYAFKFAFGDKTIYIYEIEKTTVPITYPKSERYQWSINNGDKQELLEFVSITPGTNVRTFENGVRIDIQKNKIVYQNRVRQLETLEDIELRAVKEFVEENF